MAAACSPDCRYYAALSEDGRLRVWQTDTNVLLQEYTPDLHLSAPPVCLAWIVLSSGSPTKKAKKRKSSASDPGPERHESAFVALGTTGGKILIYSIAQAKVETVLTNAKSQELRDDHVTSLDWDRDYGLHSSTGGNHVYEWNIQSASVKNKYNLNVDSRNRSADKITAIKIIPHSLGTNSRYIVTASCQLRLWSLSPLTVLRTMVGHSGAVSALARAHFVNSNKCYVASCTKTERLLSFWDVTVTPEDVSKHMNGDKSPTKKQRRKSSSEQVVNPACNFVMEDAPRCVDLAVHETDAGSSMNLAVVTRSGVLHFYGHVLNGSSTKPIKPTLTLHVSTEEAVPMPLQCCKFTAHGEHGAGEMLVGYEPAPGRLRYERVVPETQNKAQVLIRKGSPVSETKKRGEKETGTRGDEGEPSAVTYVETAAAVRKRVAPGSKVEVPMESRLANLALGTSRKDSAVNQSLTKLLVQGLHSGDKTLILTVLQQVEPGVANRTISVLPANYIPALLGELTEMASRKTSQCRAVCVWLTALLRVHSAFLLGTLNTATTSEKFSQLLAVLTQRRSHLCQLLNLKGRLDLTIAQHTRTEKQDYESEAVINYIDTSESESELEMEVAANSDDSDAGWEEEESVREASDNDQ